MIQEKDLKKYFLIISFIMGIILLNIIPPLAVPDEGVHFLNSYTYSKRQMIPTVVDGRIGKFVPKHIHDYFMLNNSRFNSNIESKFTYKDVIEQLNAKNNDIGQKFVSWWQIENTNPLGYLFSSLGMLVSRRLYGFANLSPNSYESILFGRIFNYLYFIFTVYWAIKITPRFKSVLFFLAFMPMTLFLSCSLSYDSPLIATIFLYFAYLMNFICREHENQIITIKDVLVFAFCLVVLSGIKQVYLAYALLLLCIHINKYGNFKGFLCKSIPVVIVVLLVSIGNKAIINYFTKEFEPNSLYMTINSQVQFLCAHPEKWISIIINSFKINLNFYIKSCMGILGQLDTYFLPIFYFIFYFMLLTVIMLDCNTFNHKKIETRYKAVSLVSTSLCLMGIFLGTYVIWTSHRIGIGADYVEGVQGRYFIPIIPFMIILIDYKSKYIDENLNKYSPSIAVYTSIAMCIVTTWSILIRFWL